MTCIICTVLIVVYFHRLRKLNSFRKLIEEKKTAVAGELLRQLENDLHAYHNNTCVKRTLIIRCVMGYFSIIMSVILL